MRSPLNTVARIINRTPIPYTASNGVAGLSVLMPSPNGPEHQMAAMGGNGTLFSIVNRTSNAAAQVNWRLWRKAKSGLKEDRIEVTSHAALDLLNRPNRFYTRQELIEVVQQHIDLTGEGWWVIGRDPRSTLPLELWPVRPDRMTPVPSATDYLAGYIYTGPDGEKVPLGLEDVIFMRMPNPLDPYRGMGPVQAALVDLDAEKFSAEWNRNFFRNSAQPGGVLEIDRNLTDDEFRQHQQRWAEQHKGVSNAHRVALIEGGMRWVDAKITQRDMQFKDLRDVSTTKIREAFGIPKFAVGDVGDVNRATAEASKAWFAEQLTVPRLERIKGALNNDLLPLFGKLSSDSLEFDYDNPVPPDADAQNAERQSKVTAAVALVGAGWDPTEALDAVGLPEMTFLGETHQSAQSGARSLSLAEMVQKLYLGVGTIVTWDEARQMLVDAGADLDMTVPQPAPPEPAAPDQGTPEGAPATGRRGPATRAHIHNATDDQPREDWETRLDDLLAAWAIEISPAQFDELIDQISAIVKAGTPAELATLTVASDAAAALLGDTMFAQADAAGQRTADNAKTQGVTITPATTTNTPGLAADLTAAAAVTTALLGSALAASAGREALRVWAPGSTVDQVTEAVRTHLESLGDATLRTELGGSIWAAENEGRFATLEKAETAGKGASLLIADEMRDTNTCTNCSAVDHKRYTTLADAQADYPFGGYRECQGRSRCRGTVISIWE